MNSIKIIVTGIIKEIGKFRGFDIDSCFKIIRTDIFEESIGLLIPGRKVKTVIIFITSVIEK